MRNATLILIVMLLLVAATLRLHNLTRLPAGLSTAEVVNIEIAQANRAGQIASFYRVGQTAGGYEGLFPLLSAMINGILGNGLLNLRFFSFGAGLVSVALMYALGRRLAGHYVGIVASATLMVSLYPLLLARLNLREALLLPLIIAALWMLAAAVNLNSRTPLGMPITRRYTALGVILAALAYTHWIGIIGVVGVIIFLIYLRFSGQPISRRVFGASGYAFLVFAILMIPYFTFTLRDFSASGLSNYWIQRPESIGGLVSTSLNTLTSISFIGDGMVQHNLSGHALLGVLASVLLVIGFGYALSDWRSPSRLLLLLSLGLGLLPSMWARGPLQFSLMVMAFPAIFSLVGLGAQWLAHYVLRARYPALSWKTLPLTAAVIAISVYWGGRDLFVVWPEQTQVETAFHTPLGYLAGYLDRTTDGKTTSICTFNLVRSPDNLDDPSLLRLMLHRHTTDLRFMNCLTSLVITRGGAAQRVAFAGRREMEALAPAVAPWVGQGSKHIEVAGLMPGMLRAVNVEITLADSLGRLVLTPAQWEPDANGTRSPATLPLRMGGYLTFEGYEIAPATTVKPGEVLTLATYWRIDGPQAPDLRFFAHLSRNPKTDPILQNDLLSIDATTLQDRDIILQIIPFAELPLDFPEGDYLLSIGAYRSETGERFPLFDRDTPRGNRLFLSDISVQR